ncbi:MAG: aminopeptidase P family protein [Candidatus Eisenbacteria bacterium]|nr:aminopeptidase P family protein [Candidatus Eisenbacteria bacterium]
MRNDLERLLQERELDGFVAFGNPVHSPALWYFLKGANLGISWYLGGRGGRAHLIHNPMERDDAVKVGVEMSTPAANNFRALLESSRSNAHASARMVGERLKAMGVSGRVALYGSAPAGESVELARTLEGEFGCTVVADDKLPLADEIRYTKDKSEIDTTRELGKVTCKVMGRLRACLKSLKPGRDGLARPDGTPALLGDLRTLLRVGFIEHGLVEPHGSIVAQGRDAGVPHNHGDDAQPIRAGEPIVVDIYPQQIGGGYHFDMTRTFCVGQARPELRELFETVKEAHLLSLKSFAAGVMARSYQDAVCEFFESKGHRTLRQDDKLEEGYVHSLGHGLGLELHERPRFASTPTNADVILPGTVFTVEPGLYYPSRGMGIRLEDVLVARDDGTFENLTDFPYDMEVV